MWEILAERLEQLGQPVLLERKVIRIAHNGGRIEKVVTNGPKGEEHFYGSDFISSMPIRSLVRALQPAPPEVVLRAAESLRYRDFLTVVLIVNRKHVIPDNWIYVHDPSVKVGRIQNLKNWSPAMVPDDEKTSLAMEYFVFKNDAMWNMPDAQLTTLATREIEQLGLARADEIVDGTVVRMPKAYPMYDNGWLEKVDVIRRYLDANLPNLQLVGRNGMHKYNNQDHSMMTAMYAARNIMGADYDLWAVNTEYHEEKSSQQDRSEASSSEYRRPPYAEPPRVNGQIA
jgi:protoporphyrinogen oxidase